MKHTRIRSFLSGVLLLFVSVCMVMTAWAETPITLTDKNMVNVNFVFSQGSYALGTEIAVKYSISGGSGNYRFLYYNCYSEDKGSSVYCRGGSGSDLASPSGTLYFTPTIGQKAYVEIGGSDSQGRSFKVKSKYVTLTGGESSTPVVIDIDFPESSYAVGTDISARYQITGGSGDYSLMQYECIVIDRGSTAEVKSEVLQRPSGTISFTPLFGQSAYISIWVYDSQGRSFTKESKRVSLTGGTSGSAATGSISFSKKSYKPGSLVTAKYTITGGSGSYPYMSYTCWGLEEDGARVGYKDGELTSPTGTITFTPKIGQYVGVTIYVIDSEGREFTIESKTVPLASLKKIGIKRITAVSKKKLKVEWKKLSAKDRKKIQYIQVQVSTDKNFSKIAKQKKVKSSKTSCTISGLKKNTKYYVRIRAYAKSGKNVSISAWTVKSKKTKKK